MTSTIPSFFRRLCESKKGRAGLRGGCPWCVTHVGRNKQMEWFRRSLANVQHENREIKKEEPIVPRDQEERRLEGVKRHLGILQKGRQTWHSENRRQTQRGAQDTRHQHMQGGDDKYINAL